MAYVQVKQREIYEADDQQKKKDQTISVASVLKTIGVIRSGFYSYKKHENLPAQTQIRNEHLQKEIKKNYSMGINANNGCGQGVRMLNKS